MERNYADGALGMGSLDQCNPRPCYAQTTGRSEYLENEKREATALLFQPCRMHRPEPVNERQACHHERKDKAVKLTTVTHVSVNEVMQGLGGAYEDRRGGFERGGWAPPLFVDEATTFLYGVFQRADAFLFGRRTYEIFAGSWGTWDDPGDSAIWTALNTKPKYVASTTPFDPKWSNTTVLSGDVAAAIRELKAEAGGELQVHGS